MINGLLRTVSVIDSQNIAFLFQIFANLLQRSSGSLREDRERGLISVHSGAGKIILTIVTDLILRRGNNLIQIDKTAGEIVFFTTVLGVNGVSGVTGAAAAVVMTPRSAAPLTIIAPNSNPSLVPLNRSLFTMFTPHLPHPIFTLPVYGAAPGSVYSEDGA